MSKWRFAMKLLYALAIGLFYSFYIPIGAETLFYKTDETALTEDEHIIAYDIMLNYQFPMAQYYNDAYDPAINEIEAMQSALNLTVPGVKAFYIPTTLYELFAFKFLYLNKEETAKIRSGNHMLVPINFYVSEDYSNLKDMTIFNDDANVKNHHQLINDRIVMFLKKVINFDSITIAEYREWVKCIIDALVPQATAENFEQASFLLHKAVEIDFNAHLNNQFVLWRGGSIPEMRQPSVTQLHNYFKGHGIEQLYDTMKNISVSYGSSLFAGTLGETTACPFHYIMQLDANWKGDFGYALHVSKNILCKR